MHSYSEREPSLQMRAESQPLQMVNNAHGGKRTNRRSETIQMQSLQKVADSRLNRASSQEINNTGLPSQLKSGIEQLSGFSMNDVKVHYNSHRPAQLQAHAYAQGNQIHLGPGQERHLPHEAWHVVQQKQGRVKPTLQLKGNIPVNEDKALEREADQMGRRALIQKRSSLRTYALQFKAFEYHTQPRRHSLGLLGNVVQRVGGEKIGFEFSSAETSEVVAQGQAKLNAIWKAARQARHDQKVGAEKTAVETDAQRTIDARKRQQEREEYRKKKAENPSAYPQDVGAVHPKIPKNQQPAPGGFTAYYAGLLKAHQGDKARLLDLAEFKDGTFKLDAGDKIMYSPTKKDPYVQIAVLKSGEHAFALKTAKGGEGGPKRDIFRKQGVDTSVQDGTAKEYVKDSRGVITRRYAYVEKNYYQMMEFFMTHHAEGRFQAYMRAAGDKKPNIYEHRDEGVDLVRGQKAAPDAKDMTMEQMAVAHQKLGSSPQQRGVSLTSTPKVNATYVNTGQNFRTNDGFRMKVDLSRISAEDALLINHYSHGGVIHSEKTGSGYDTSRDRTSTSKYPYADSSIHARELLLEHLKPEWVVGIEHHKNDNTTGTGAGSTTVDHTTALGTHSSMFAKAKADFGGDSYQLGFNYGLTHTVLPKDPRKNDSNFTRGFDGSRLFMKGWNKGWKEYKKDGHKDAESAKTLGISLPQYRFDISMKDTAPEVEYDLYRYGYLVGRSGKAAIRSHKELVNYESKMPLKKAPALMSSGSSGAFRKTAMGLGTTKSGLTYTIDHQ